MWPKRYEQKETQKHKKVKMDDRNNETNWKNIMNIQQCCKLGNLGSLIGWESSGLQRTQIGLWRKHCIASARWLLLFLEGTKNTKEEYFVFGILTQCHGNDVNSCGCESAKIFRFLFFDLWFMCFDEIWWDMMICRIVSPIPLCGAIAVRHGWQKLPTLEQCWSLTQHRCKSQPFWPFRDRLKIQGDGHNGNNQHNRQHTHTHTSQSRKRTLKHLNPNGTTSVAFSPIFDHLISLEVWYPFECLSLSGSFASRGFLAIWSPVLKVKNYLQDWTLCMHFCHEWLDRKLKDMIWQDWQKGRLIHVILCFVGALRMMARRFRSFAAGVQWMCGWIFRSTRQNQMTVSFCRIMATQICHG